MRMFKQRILVGTLLALATATPAHADEGLFGFLQSAASGLSKGISGFVHQVAQAASNNSDNSDSIPPQQQPPNPPVPTQYGSDESDIQLPANNVTQNAAINLNADIPDGTRWLMLKVKKVGNNDDGYQSTEAWTSGQSLPTAYLSQGPGEYTVSFFYSTSPARVSSYWGLTSYSVQNQDPDDLSYLLPSLEVQSDSPEIKALAAQITSGASTDLQKSQAIHDWVASHIGYDVDAYFAGTYGNKNYDALSVLHEQVAICDGYTNLTTALHRAVGIRARGVLGMVNGAQCDPSVATNHAWNEVWIDGRWVVEDTTWDAGGVDFRTRSFTSSLSETYFDPNPASFAQSHARCGTALR